MIICTLSSCCNSCNSSGMDESSEGSIPRVEQNHLFAQFHQAIFSVLPGQFSMERCDLRIASLLGGGMN